MARENAPPRVFVDANVFFSGVYSPAGPPYRILVLHAQRQITLVVSRQIIEELVRTLRRKAPAAVPVAMSYFDGALPVLVEDPTEKAVDALAGQVNAKDCPIVAAALGGEVDYFVTGDRQLADEIRAIAHPFHVLTPREFIKRFPHA